MSILWWKIILAALLNSKYWSTVTVSNCFSFDMLHVSCASYSTPGDFNHLLKSLHEIIFVTLILVFILWVKWLFWLRRWKEVLHVYIHNLELNLIPNQIALYNSLFIIMGIILHDVLQKTIKIFYFSRFKPSSLQFTPTQLLSAALDSLLGSFDSFNILLQWGAFSPRSTSESLCIVRIPYSAIR